MLAGFLLSPAFQEANELQDDPLRQVAALRDRQALALTERATMRWPRPDEETASWSSISPTATTCGARTLESVLPLPTAAA